MSKKAMIAELEEKVAAGKKELERIRKEKDELEGKLKNARGRIGELEGGLKAAQDKIGALEARLEDTDLKELKEKAKKSAVEFEGLKQLYSGKIRELDESRESQEEEFARESAVKRNNLAEEIQASREENQEKVSNTVKVFAGSYLYYMDQIRMMMDALSQAASETGKTLFEGSVDDVRERFGASIADHLRNDVGALEQSAGDRLLIGAEEKPADREEPEEEAPEEEDGEPELCTVKEPDEDDD